MTEETPLHNALKPSVADIRLNAFPMPVYIAAGDVVKTCIRVCGGIHWVSMRPGLRNTENCYFNHICGEHHRVLCDSGLEKGLGEFVIYSATAGVTHQCPS